MTALRSPTVRRRRIARELKKLREATDMNLAQAAKALGMSQSNLSRIENRETAAKPVFVRAALALYGVTGPDAEALIEISRGAQQRGWWQSYTDVMPDWFGFYVGLEEEAATIETYESEIVPGLLQTAAYARAMFRLTAGDEDIDRKTAARMHRQDVLRRSRPAHVHAILNEAIVHRVIESPKTMADQLNHLVALGESDNVTIQVLPFSAGGHPAMTGPFVVLGFPDAVDEPVVYLDNYTVGHVLEEQEQFSWYQQAHADLRELALTPEKSLNRLAEAARKIG